MLNNHPKDCGCGCCYGYHEHLTLAYGDGFYDTWICDLCGKEAICTGELQNYGAEKMTEYWMKIINNIEYLENLAKIDDTKGKFAKELLKLHKQIEDVENRA